MHSIDMCKKHYSGVFGDPFFVLKYTISVKSLKHMKNTVSFVGEKRWESTNLGVTPNDVLTVLKTKVKYILLYTLHRRRSRERSGIVYSSKNRKVGR